MSIAKQVVNSNFLSLSRQQPELFLTPSQFQLSNGTLVDICAPGIIRFTPPTFAHKDIVLSAGIHGNETAPIEICDDFVEKILRCELALAHRALFIFGNLPAMDQAKRFVAENMNRLFSGAHSAGSGLVNAERHRAKQIEQCITDFFTQHTANGQKRQRLHYDLHTAIRTSKNERFAIYPYTNGKPHSKAQLQFLKACGVTTILLFGTPQPTLAYFSASTFAAHAFTIELGQVRPFGQNDMSRFTAVRESLSLLLSQQELALKGYAAEDFQLYRINQEIAKQSADFRLHFADDVANFTDYAQGTVLASDGDKTYMAEQDGEAIVFPNADVALGQRALLTVLPTTLEG